MRAVIFDVDGTLVDTIPLIVESMNVAVAPIIGRDMTKEEVVSHFGPIEVEMVRDVVGDELADEAGRRFVDHYNGSLGAVHLYPGVRELLDELERCGVAMAAVTGKSIYTARTTLAALDLERYFPVVLGGDCGFSPKPDPDCVLEAIRVLGAAPEDTLLVGDSANDLRSARAAGAKGGLAAWDLHTGRLEDIAPLAHCVFHMPSDVLAAL